jgi:acetylornithine deacetylase/succinyl-diaminopimelate desuccinylase-like protein
VSLSKTALTPDIARLAALLERLVAIDTQNPPGRETEAAALLASELDAVGFATEVRPLRTAEQMSSGESTAATAPVSLSTRIWTPFRSAAAGPTIPSI